jgi:hypothetical protein
LNIVSVVVALEGVTWELPRPFGELPWGLSGDCEHVRVLTRE